MWKKIKDFALVTIIVLAIVAVIALVYWLDHLRFCY